MYQRLILLMCVILGLTLLASRPALAADAAGKTLDVTQAGVVGDGVTLNTAAIQKAIDGCSAQGGGTLSFPAGRFLTGTIQIKDNVTLHLDENAVLLGSTSAADYRIVDPFTAGDGVPLGYALIVALDAKHVGIEGAGSIDGQGKSVAAAQKPYSVRPFLMRWIRCTNVSLSGVHLSNPGAWTNHFFQCRDVAVNHVTIRSYATGLRNNDGIDIDSCQGVNIADCDIESGDDSICIKATSPQPSRDLTITRCKLKTRCNAIKLGTESLGDFQHIQVSHCDAHDIGMAGIALYAVDGAHLQDVVCSDITMDGVVVPISIRLGARLKTFRPGDQARPPGILRDVTLRNVRVTRAARIGLLINGIPDHPVENVTLEEIQIAVPGGGSAQDAQVQLEEKESAYPEMTMFGKVMPAYGAYLRHVRGMSVKNVRITPANPDARPAAVLIDAQGAAAGDFAVAP